MTTLAPALWQKFFDNNGIPLKGGKLFTYSAGTSTKLATYTDSTGVTPNQNPIILDFRGEANVWVPPNVSYKFVLAPPTDTDPPSNPIKTIDNVVNGQLLTLYGGVDTGSTNAYVLNFTANFSAYTDGIAIYWIPSNINTGASTVNVNGLGPVAITNQDGSALGAGQLQNGQISLIMYIGTGFKLLSTGNVPMTGTFIGALTGLTASVPVTVTYFINGRFVYLYAAATGTSSTTAFTLTGIPSFLRPTQGGHIDSCMLEDNTVNAGGWGQITTAGTINFGLGINNNQSGFTASGTKGLPAGWQISYPLG